MVEFLLVADMGELHRQSWSPKAEEKLREAKHGSPQDSRLLEEANVAGESWRELLSVKMAPAVSNAEGEGQGGVMFEVQVGVRQEGSGVACSKGHWKGRTGRGRLKSFWLDSGKRKMFV